MGGGGSVGPRATRGVGRGLVAGGRCEEGRRQPGESGRSGARAGAEAAHSLAGTTLTDSPATRARASYSRRQRRPGAAPPTAHARSAGAARECGAALPGAREAERRCEDAPGGGVGASVLSEQSRNWRRRRRRRRPGDIQAEFGSGGGRWAGRARFPPTPFSLSPLSSSRLCFRSSRSARSSPVFLLPLPLASSSPSVLLATSFSLQWEVCAAEGEPRGTPGPGMGRHTASPSAAWSDQLPLRTHRSCLFPVFQVLSASIHLRFHLAKPLQLCMP